MAETANKSMIEFGRWVRRWREECGYTQEELGAKAGVKKQYISNLERAEPSSYTGNPTRPDIDIVDKLALALKRPILEARNPAGYGMPDAQIATVEKALNAAGYFEFQCLTDDDKAQLRPLLEIVDREAERIRTKPIFPDPNRPQTPLVEFVKQPILENLPDSPDQNGKSPHDKLPPLKRPKKK